MVTDPAQVLLLDYLKPQSEDHILILEGGDGRLAHAVANQVPYGKVLNLTRDVREVWASKTRLNKIPNAESNYEVLPSKNDWDVVLLVIPKERRYARTLLIAARDALKTGGRLLLAGPTRRGAKAIIKDAEKLFGESLLLGYRSHHRIASCFRHEFNPTYIPKEFQQIGVNPETTHTINVTGPHGSLTLGTHPGIFSWDAIDEGTALLMKHLTISPGCRVWDVGCGYGIIGLTAALAGASSVTMTDVNLLGVDYTKQNAERNHLSNRVCIYPADGLKTPPELPPGYHFPTRSSFDLIVSNPAFHQGYRVDKSMADEMVVLAPEFLTQTGHLLIVANRFLNYDKRMQQVFNSVMCLAETSKYHLLMATNA